MEKVELWTAGLCICAAAIGIAEKLLPEGNVRSAVYFVMGLIVISCFLSPIGSIPEPELAVPEQEVQTDWLNRTTNEMFGQRINMIVSTYLENKEIVPQKIETYTDIDSDGGIYIDMVRITLGSEYKERIDEICACLLRDLGIDADVVIKTAM